MARKLIVEIIGDARSLETAFAKAELSSRHFGSSMNKASAASALGAKAGLLAKGGLLAVAAGAGYAVKKAEELHKAQESLTVAIQHTHGNAAKLEPQYAKTAKAAAQFGINQADATTALARATLLTGDAERAQRAYTEAVVISKATGKDFGAVLTATAKGQDGITTSLRRYGILLDKSSSGQQQLNQVMKTFGGQAEANTTPTEKFHAALDNLTAQLGTYLLPAFTHVMNGLTSGINWIATTGVPGLINFGKTVAKYATAAFNDAKGAVDTMWHGIDAAWNATKTAVEAPAKAVKAAAGGVKDGFDAVKSAMVAIKDAAGVVWDALKTALEVAAKPIKAQINAVKAGFDDVKDAIHAIRSAAGVVFGALDNVVKAAIKPIQSALGPIIGAFDAVRGALGAIEGAAHSALSAIESVVTAHPVAPGNAIGPSIGGSRGPGRALGGSVLAGMQYTVGEHGPEQFVPLTSGVIVPNRGGSGGGVQVHVHGNVYGDVDLERVVTRAVVKANRKGGLLVSDLR